ncbi:transcriptional regulator YeiL [Sutcliffiella rhizosphaerae]|uniref:Regulatory protein YeiL n=1 Tax=Sutcliffiella rhizosphaerae TaxID=2880967 RepID=A0ABM8YRX5_9BACI|nr:transcriptional regulator YeiL [Sutcliffiella rhizosphaerae]CAG9622744.1 Regulatory protein YeiL [Sutcliffiella rhizosphaerae]
MKVYKEDKKRLYMEHHSIAHLFSFPVEEVLEVHEYERDEWIIQEGMRPYYLFYVVEGKAKIYVTHQNGKVSLINFVHVNDYIGEMELIQDVYYTKGIQASTKTICFALPIQQYRAKLMEDAKFLRELTKFLSVKASFMAMKYSQGLAFPLENRLADFILLTADEGIYREKHVTVCNYLGISYRHLLHVLNQFCEKKFLKKEGRNYQITQYQSLEKLAEEMKNN